MKLEKLSLANCGGFEQIDIGFEDDITVIAGVNGVGKSTILRALAILLSRALPAFTPARTRPIYFTDADIHTGAQQLQASMDIDVYGKKICVFVIRGHDDKDKSDRNPRELSAFPHPLNREELLNINAVKTLPIQPIAVFFTPKRRLPGRSRSASQNKPYSQANAYEQALNDREVELKEFMRWYRAQMHLARDPGGRATRRNTLVALQDVVTRFIPELKKLYVQDSPFGFVVEKEGKTFYIHQLSDGERGLLAIVLDLARRLSIANPGLDDPIAEGRAIVLIDEIELHLHPKWQRHVLRNLKNVFKNCQFVVTTHSPQVIGQAQPCQLRLLEYRGEKIGIIQQTQSFGMDSGWILQHIMGVSARDYETEQTLKRIYDAIDSANFTDAKHKAECLRNEIGDFPDLQEIFGLLDRMEMLGEI